MGGGGRRFLRFYGLQLENDRPGAIVAAADGVFRVFGPTHAEGPAADMVAYTKWLMQSQAHWQNRPSWVNLEKWLSSTKKVCPS